MGGFSRVKLSGCRVGLSCQRFVIYSLWHFCKYPAPLDFGRLGADGHATNGNAQSGEPCGGSSLAGKSQRDAALKGIEVGRARSLAVRAAALLIPLLMAGCAPLFVVSSLQPGAFLLLNLSYLSLAILAGGIVVGARAVLHRMGRAASLDPSQKPWLLGAIAATAVTLSYFQVFKQLVLPGRGFPLDPIIAAAEQKLLLGHDAWEVTHALFGSLVPTLILDTAYALWLPIMFLFPAAVVVAIADRQVRGRLVGTWVISWILIGSYGAWLLASAGPCYFNALVGPHEGYVRMTEALHALNRQASHYGLSVQALYFQDMLRQSQGGPLVFASGISAMPSMHVAMATLFVIGGFQKSRRLGYFFLCYALLIWIASIHLGWHYAADGILGALMMTSLWLVSAPVARLIAFGVRAAAPAKHLQTS